MPESNLPELTPRQQSILDYINRTLDEYQMPPTVREIAEEFGMSSTNGVTCHLKAIQKKGYIDWTPNLSRSLVVNGRREKCPHCGKQISYSDVTEGEY